MWSGFFRYSTGCENLLPEIRFFVRLWSVGRMRKKSANLRESRSLRSLNESRARIVARLPFGSAWLIAIATAHAGQYPVGRKIHAEIKSSCKNSYIPSLLACAVAVAISHDAPQGRRATIRARDSLSDRRERDSRRFADFLSHPSRSPLNRMRKSSAANPFFGGNRWLRKEIRKGIHYCHLP